MLFLLKKAGAACISFGRSNTCASYGLGVKGLSL